MSASPRLFAQAKPSPPPLPREPHFYSAQQIQKGVTLPPLPANPFPDLDLYPLGGGDYAYDDRDVDYDLLREQAELEKALTAALVGAAPLSAPLDFGPDDLGLEIHDATVGVTGWTADLTIHPPSTPAFPYDLFYTPTLDEPISWRFLMRCTSTEVIARWLCQEQGYFMLTKISGNLGVSTATTAQQMAESLVPSFVTVANATYTGHADARGIFWNGNSCGLPVDSGVILSSGPVSNAYGPNDDDGEDAAVYGYSDMEQPGDSDLEGLVGGGETVDAAVLEFDVSSPISFDLKVQFLYASEEYPEWIGDHNDPMAIFVNGSVVNVALVPGTSDPIAVHTINGGCVADAGGAPTPATNPAYYVDNYDPYYSALPQYAADDDMFNIQYDGMTILLQSEIPIPATVATHRMVLHATTPSSVRSSCHRRAGAFNVLPCLTWSGFAGCG